MTRWPAAVLAASSVTGALGCTVVAVGKDASATGHPLVAHTDDSGAATSDIRLVRVPRKTWPEGSTRKLYPWKLGYPRVVAPELAPDYAPVDGQQVFQPIGEIPQVPETYAYWDMDYGVQNEMGLSMAESTCTAKTAGWPATPDKPYGYNRASIEDLTKIALERCATARCAVDTMGAIAVEHGFYSDDSGEPTDPDYEDSAEALAIADPEELWVFNVITGRNNASAIWAGMRIPSDHILSIANSFTIRKMNLSDHDNFRYSKGVTELAEEKGWWKPADDAPGVFDFYGAYGYTVNVSTYKNRGDGEMAKDILSFYTSRRMWRGFSLLSPSEGAKLDPNRDYLPETKDAYPASVPAPKGSVTPRMVMNVLRDHYEGTPYDLTQGMAAGPFGSPNRGPVTPFGVVGIWERAISMHRTSFSHIAVANADGNSVLWMGLDAPHGTAYLPWFGAAAEGAPEEFRSHEGYQSKFSTKVAWWAFNIINQYQDLNYQVINKDVLAKANKVEDEAEKVVAECLAKAGNSENRGKVLAQCGNDFATKVVADWWDFAWSLFAKFGRYSITHNESENGMGLMVYPAWWLNSAEVGYTMWAKRGPFHGIPDPAPLASVASALSAVFGEGAASPVPLFWMAVSIFVGMFSFKMGTRNGRELEKREGESSRYVYMAA
mmetsp:Transcript_67833/g.189973  ORF Transcript_67833/g.189973 Transcript_67833/m.189973 type:complete len:662 (-) Transcript_67833:41-2026(-)